MSWLEKHKAKKKLKYLFFKAELYKEHTSGGNNKVKVYPKIHDVNIDEKRVRYVFTLPNGLDPKLIEKKWYCFEQVFNTNIEIKGELKKFILYIYKYDRDMKPYNYNYTDISTLLVSYKLPILCGKNINNETIIFDLVEHPHILVAGETGSGKSSMLRVILTTLIQYLKFSKLELYLGDLKRSEFHFLRNIEHVKEVCMDEDNLLNMLMKIQAELIKRGNILDENELSHIDEYNKQNKEKIPYIILCIDEVALLQDEKDSMKIIEKVSSIGRSLGVFLILSMQRPDSKVLDGKLKNNMTVRMGFRCADEINSRIIGTKGAEKITQSGRMILKIEQLEEIQAPYLELDKAKDIVKPYKVDKKPIQTQQEEQQVFGVLDNEGTR